MSLRDHSGEGVWSADAPRVSYSDMLSRHGRWVPSCAPEQLWGNGRSGSRLSFFIPRPEREFERTQGGTCG